jgi:hypothetical protein
MAKLTATQEQALLKNVGLVKRANVVGSTEAASIRRSQAMSDMLNSF